MKPARRVALAALAGLAALALNGCWDLKSIDNRALVVAIAVDRAEAGGVEVALQPLNPKQTESDTSVRPEASRGSPRVTASGRGETIAEAVREIERSASRHVDFSHAKVVLFGEELARDGIGRHLDFFLRHPEIKLVSWALVARGRAGDLLRGEPRGLEPTVFRQVFLSQGGLGNDAPEVYSEPIWRLYRDSIDRGRDALMPVVEERDGLLRYAGAAVMRGPRMVGMIGPHETALLNMVLHRAPLAVLAVPDPTRPGQRAVVHVMRARGRVGATRGGERPAFRVRLALQARLVEVSGLGGRRPDEMRRIATALARRLEADLRDLIARLQGEFGGDVLGLGKELRAFDPERWGRLRGWEQVYPQAPVEVSVGVEIVTGGL